MLINTFASISDPMSLEDLSFDASQDKKKPCLTQDLLGYSV